MRNKYVASYSIVEATLLLCWSKVPRRSAETSNQSWKIRCEREGRRGVRVSVGGPKYLKAGSTTVYISNTVLRTHSQHVLTKIRDEPCNSAKNKLEHVDTPPTHIPRSAFNSSLCRLDSSLLRPNPHVLLLPSPHFLIG